MRASVFAISLFLYSTTCAVATPKDSTPAQMIDLTLDYILNDEPLPIVKKLHKLYQETSPVPKPRRNQKGPRRNSQSILQPTDNTKPTENAPKENNHPHGQISMQTKDQQIHTFNFSYSPRICSPLTSEIPALVAELNENLLLDHPEGPVATAATDFVPSLDEVELIGFERGEKEFRASLEFRLEGEVSGEEWRELVDLMGRTVGSVVESRGEIGLESGLGMVEVKGRVGDVVVLGRWVFYEMRGGVIVECGEGDGKEEGENKNKDKNRDREGVWDLGRVEIVESVERHHDL